MINHYRTLLLNLSGENWPGLEYPGEELVPSLFTENKLSGFLNNVHTLLFGHNADRACLNYRLRQYTTMWHDGVLNGEALAVDSRVTYWPLKFAADMNKFGSVTVEKVNGPVTPSYRLMQFPESPYAEGKCEYILKVSVENGVCTALDEKTRTVHVAESLGGYFQFNNNLRIQLDNGEYRITAFMPPGKDIGQVLVDAEQLLGTSLELELFRGKKEMLALWRGSEDIGDKLGSLSLALAMELDKVKAFKKNDEVTINA